MQPSQDAWDSANTADNGSFRIVSIYGIRRDLIEEAILPIHRTIVIPYIYTGGIRIRGNANLAIESYHRRLYRKTY